jgi:hypothetical protein
MMEAKRNSGIGRITYTDIYEDLERIHKFCLEHDIDIKTATDLYLRRLRIV